MAWTAISDFTNGQVVTATILNQLVGNLAYLSNRNSYSFEENGVLTTTGGTFVSMGANYEYTIAMTGGPLLVLLTGQVRVTAGGAPEYGYFDIELDGTRLGHTTDGLSIIERETNTGTVDNNFAVMMSLGRIISGLSVANHTVKMMWRDNGSGAVQIGYGPSRVKFLVKEL